MINMSPKKWNEVEEMAHSAGWQHVMALLSVKEVENERIIYAPPTPENQFDLHQAVGGSRVIRDIVSFVASASHNQRLSESEISPTESVDARTSQ